MTLGAAVFASVVLILLVYNRPFRKVSAWIAGISTGLALIGALGWYVYTRYQNYAQEKQVALHKKLVDACVARYSKSGYAKTDPWAKYLDVQASCENNPNTDWSSKPVPKFNPDAPYGTVVEIRGGETLNFVPSKETPTSFTPLLYLGHGQKFAVACGNFGEPGKFPTTGPVREWDEHGNPIIGELSCR